MNKFIGIGRLTKDVELRTTESGKTCGTFTIAINRKFKNQNGDYETDFFNCVIWNNAETLAEYTKKGDLIGIEGRLQTRNYESDGIKRYITEIIVESFDFIATKKETKEEEFEKVEDTTNPFELDDDSLPF